MTLLSKIAMGVGVGIVTPLVFPGKVNSFQCLGIGLLAYYGVNYLETMTVEKMKRIVRKAVIVGAGVGTMIKCGVECTGTVTSTKSAMTVPGTGDFAFKFSLRIPTRTIVIGLGLMCIYIGTPVLYAGTMSYYPFSRGISPHGISANALELCRRNPQVQEILGESIEIQDSRFITEGLDWKMCRRIYPCLFRVFEICSIAARSTFISRSGHYKFYKMGSFVIIGDLQKGTVKWKAGARDVGRWEYMYLTVEVKEEYGGPVRTIQVPFPEGEISNGEPIIEVAEVNEIVT